MPRPQYDWIARDRQLLACPECGAPLDYDPRAPADQTGARQTRAGLQLESRRQTVPILACTGCEWLCEVTTGRITRP